MQEEMEMILRQWLGVQDYQQGTQWNKRAHTSEEGDLTWPLTCSVGKSCPFFMPPVLFHKVGRAFPALIIVTIFNPAAIY